MPPGDMAQDRQALESGKVTSVISRENKKCLPRRDDGFQRALLDSQVARTTKGKTPAELVALSPRSLGDNSDIKTRKSEAQTRCHQSLEQPFHTIHQRHKPKSTLRVTISS